MTIPDPAVPGTDEMNLGLLAIAYPQFAISALPGGRRLRWQVVRRNATDPGLYAIITPDLTEAYQAMAADAPPAACPEEARP
jgi:hypothetical protein